MITKGTRGGVKKEEKRKGTATGEAVRKYKNEKLRNKNRVG